MAEFYGTSGGVVSFADRVAFALGIQASQIKVVSVYQGSVVLDYYIAALPSDTNSKATLATLTT